MSIFLVSVSMAVVKGVVITGAVLDCIILRGVSVLSTLV